MSETTKSPMVSIVTPSFNQGRFIERTIKSVLCQNYSNIEYIIIDAMSTDETSSVLDKYRHLITRVVQEKDNGQADAIDKGFKLSSGSIMAYLNSDDCYASPRVITDVVKKFDELRDVDLIYGRRYIVDESGFYLHGYPYRPFNKDELLVADYIPQECCFWRRSIFDKSGGNIDQSYQFAMDYELWLRFLSKGARFVSIDNVLGLFRKHDEQKTEAAWCEKGLPEIARLQQKYLGRTVSERDMKLAFVAHYMGLNELSNPRQARLFASLWGQHVRRNQLVMGIAPLDVWMLGAPLNSTAKP